MDSFARASAALAAAVILTAAPAARAQLERSAMDEANPPAAPRNDKPNARVSLSAADADTIHGVYLVSTIPQDDIRKQTERFIRTTVNFVRAPGGAGIIGAIIGAAIADAIINNQVKTRLERSALALPIILDQVKDLDFREEFWRRLGARLGGETRFDIAEEVYLKEERGHLDIPAQVRGVPVDAVLDLETTYYLSADLRVLVVRLSVLLQSRDQSKVFHRAIYAYDTPPVSDEGYEAAARAWAADEGAAFRSALVGGAEQVLQLLYGDMLGKDRYTAAAGAELHVSDLGRSSFSRVIGTVVEQKGDRYVVRVPNGNLISTARGKRYVAEPDAGADTVAQEGAPTTRLIPPVSLDDLKDLLPAGSPK
jgi:hypothetical protein